MGSWSTRMGSSAHSYPERVTGQPCFFYTALAYTPNAGAGADRDKLHLHKVYRGLTGPRERGKVERKLPFSGLVAEAGASAHHYHEGSVAPFRGWCLPHVLESPHDDTSRISRSIRI